MKIKTKKIFSIIVCILIGLIAALLNFESLTFGSKPSYTGFIFSVIYAAAVVTSGALTKSKVLFDVYIIAAILCFLPLFCNLIHIEGAVLIPFFFIPACPLAGLYAFVGHAFSMTAVNDSFIVKNYILPNLIIIGVYVLAAFLAGRNIRKAKKD